MDKIKINGRLIWDTKKPRFNPFQTGTGAHRNKNKIIPRKKKYKDEI